MDESKGRGRPRTSGLRKYVIAHRRRLSAGQVRVYYRFRKPGWPERPLPADPDSREFDALYWRYRDEIEKPSTPAQAVTRRTIGALVEAYQRHSFFTDLAPRTQKDYRRALDYIAEGVGDLPVTQITPMLVSQAQEENLHRRRFARLLVEVFSIIGSFAVLPLGWLAANPVKGGVIRKAKLAGKGYRRWTSAEIEAFRSACDPDLTWEVSRKGKLVRERIGEVRVARARLWFEIMLSTALRPTDAIKVRWSDYSEAEGLIKVVQGKDRQNNELFVPVTPALAELLAETPKQGFTVLASSRNTKPIGYEAAMEAFTAIRQAARLPIGPGGVSPHGLRKTLGAMLAEGGASDAEIQAVTLHKSLRMVQLYRAGAAQKLLALQAMERVGHPRQERPTNN